jgi:mRNA interferase MazF
MTFMAKAPLPKRGEVWLVDFDPAVGAEMRKTRPAVVLNVDTVGRLPLRIVVPITDWKPIYANFSWFVPLPVSPRNGLTKDSAADSFQVKSVSEKRFVRCLGVVTSSQVDDIAAAVALCVGAP